MPKGTIQCSTKTFSMFFGDVSNIGTACICLEYLLMMIATYRFSLDISESGLRISMATTSNSCAAEKSCRFLLSLILLQFFLIDNASGDFYRHIVILHMRPEKLASKHFLKSTLTLVSIDRRMML